ncbi:High mobility group B protein 2 [Zea mays]|uniref:High mobility group B protein 2 n=1 Tax=Zea mays TaxID=4577 RepID=A0A1D6IAX2_MAIZE|nr:High mobility group B protein 2 [Zea mays]
MKSRARSTAGDSRLSVRKTKAEKDPNKPKRPPSAFFVFMEEFRKDYKEKHPNVKQVSVIGKAGGDKWKSLSDAVSLFVPQSHFNRLSPQLVAVATLQMQEKAPYVSKAEKLKAEYTKKIDAYNNKQSGDPTASGDSDKSKSEVNDEDEEGDE